MHANTLTATNHHFSASSHKPFPTEVSRSIMELSSVGTLSTLTHDGWPLGVGVCFPVDQEGTHVLCLNRTFSPNKRSALHVQVKLDPSNAIGYRLCSTTLDSASLDFTYSGREAGLEMKHLGNRVYCMMLRETDPLRMMKETIDTMVVVQGDLLALCSIAVLINYRSPTSYEQCSITLITNNVGVQIMVDKGVMLMTDIEAAPAPATLPTERLLPVSLSISEVQE
ncbi:unnamed protein product [Microthlaspi erraticum]|uniref:Uncharacterized protein n=1 Tax=Microthlaspi erraticum TaxID=1685480 RepID=A0A6D2J6Z6_9BRAS|nr:unnamed protein product [Microthlaspi erraticum]